MIYGIYRTSAGTYYDRLTSVTGCDSVNSTALTVHSLPAIPTITQSGTSLASSSTVFYQWYYFDTLLTGATSQFHTPVKSGFYSVEITDTNGCSIMSDPFDFTLTAISEIEKTYGMMVFPNPNTGTFIFKLNTQRTEKLDIKIYNISGQLIFTESAKVNGAYEKQFDLKDFTVGIYQLQVETEQGTITRQVIIEQ